MDYHYKYIKYKTKYIDLKLSRVESEEAEHNIFYYLEQFKRNVIKIVKESYKHPEKNHEMEKQIGDMFFRWYLNNIDDDYIPRKQFDIKKDLEYQHEKKGFKVPIDSIIDKINKEIGKLNENTKHVNNKYSYKSIFSELQINLLKNKYTGLKEDFEKHRNFLSELYNFMGGTHNHLSIPPEIIPDDCVELFGTPVNTKNNYCSPFAIEKEFFNSKGSFFKYEIKSGLHVANPPFDEAIMNKMADRLIEQMSKSEKIDIIIVIPQWDDVAAYKNMINSKYHIKHSIIRKGTGKFFNYYKQIYAPIVDCHCIHLSNYDTKYSLDKFIHNWSLVK
jgi:hypothetical protein